MTDTAAAEALFRDLNRRFDRLDVLVNNAGSGSMNAIALTPVDVAPFGVTCNAVGPCPIRTKLTASVPVAKIQALIDRRRGVLSAARERDGDRTGHLSGRSGVILDCVLDRMAGGGAAPALAVGDTVYTYRELVDRVAYWSGRLRDRTIFGRVVSIEGEYGFETVAAFLAAARFRNVIMPLSDASAAHHEKFLEIGEVEYRIRPSGGDDAISWTGCAASHDFYARLRRAEVPGLVLFSSGSTGRQKAAVHDLDALLKKFLTRRHCYRTLVFLQLDHIGGINTLFYTLANGGMVVVADGRMPRDVCRAVAQHGVELLPTSPTFLNLLLLSEEHTRHDLSSLKLITYGTEPMLEITLARVRAAFPEANLLQTYGLSELGILRSQSREAGSLWMRGGGEGFETKIVDGRLFIRARSAMLGYLNAPSPFAAEGFFDTGDLVEVDGDWIRIIGRHTEVINVGGNKVFPMEVENPLLALDNVDDVAVHGESNPFTGQVVVASVTLSREEDLASFKTRMRLFCRDRLAAYKIPAKVLLVRTLHSARFKKIRRAMPVPALIMPHFDHSMLPGMRGRRGRAVASAPPLMGSTR